MNKEFAGYFSWKITLQKRTPQRENVIKTLKSEEHPNE